MNRPSFFRPGPAPGASDAEREAAVEARAVARRAADARRQNLVTVVASLASMDQQRSPDAVVSYAVDLLDEIERRVLREAGAL